VQNLPGASTRFTELATQFGEEMAKLVLELESGLRANPTSNMKIGDLFGCRCRQAHEANGHNGVDLLPIVRKVDGDPIYASISGTVNIVNRTNTGSAGIYAQVVSLDGTIVTQYMHLSKILVDDGVYVRAGTDIAEMGSTGRSTGTHLHFGVQIDGKYVDPLDFLELR
jgi:murein DD-endopeptidase MepM/ murein hydrolase activator NlpD